jgi:regulatory protein
MRIESVEKGASTTKIVGGGSSFLCRHRYLEALGLDPASLEAGAELDEEGLGLLGLAAKATEAETRAAGLLDRAEQVRFLLSVKLEKHELPRQAIKLALDYLEGQGILDDERFARAWLRSKMGSAMAGPAKLLMGLRAKGIDEAVAKKAMAAVFGADERKAALAKAWERALKQQGGDRDRAKAVLRDLGFKSQEIRDYFEGLENI